MESQVPLSSLLPVLPAEMAGQIKEIVGDVEGTMVHRKSAVDPTAHALDPGAREVLQYVSTRDIDREAEILDPAGCVLTEFKKAPQVLWGHDYSLPPIGSDRIIEKNDYGVQAVTKYAETDMGNDIWMLRRDGHLKTSSVGFVPMAATRKGDDGWSKLTEKLAAKWQVAVTMFEKVDSIISKWLLLEHSDVTVPANIHALTIVVGPDEEGKQLEALLASGAIKTKGVSESLTRTIKELRAAAADKFKCECIECGFKAESEEHCNTFKCPKCGGTMRRAERPGPGQPDEDGLEPEKGQPVTIHVVEQPRIIQVIDPDEFKRNARVCIMQIRGQLE